MSSTSTLDLELNSSELRSKLFHSFKSKGMVQSVKAQLRKQLALELHEKAISSKIRNKETKFDGSLFQRICNSLLLDHLKRCKYDYTLSVFITESHTNLEKAIPLHEILDTLHINNNSKLYQHLINTCTDECNVKGFLWSFLLAIGQDHGNSTSERSVQTDVLECPSLDKKMFDMEKVQLEKLQSSIKNDYESVEAKVLAFQRRYEQQKQAELKCEMERFRSSTMANMRLEEREKCHKEFLQMKEDLEKRYDSKLKDLERRELQIGAKALRQEQAVEKDGYEQRQKILEEMEVLKNRDMELKRNHKSALSAVEIEEEKLKAKEEQLKQKEKSIQEMEEQYENKLKHEILRIKLELQEKDIEQAAAMEIREQHLREEKMNFLSQKDKYMKWKEEADHFRGENERLNISTANAKQSIDILSQKYEKVCEQYQQVSDYREVQNDNMVLKKELEICKKSYADVCLEKAQQKRDHQKLVRDLLNKINQNSPELENEMKALQEREQSVSLKYEVLQNQHELLQKSHVLQIRKNEELRKLYEDNILCQKELLRECDELKLELHFANQEKESVRRFQSDKPKLTLPTSLCTTKHELIISTKESDLPSNGRAGMDLDFNVNIAASSDILQKLELEALELEKSYKQFQERQSSIKTHLPVKVENTKVPRTTLQSAPIRPSDDVKLDATTLRTKINMKSDSSNMNSQIPTKEITELNDGKILTNFSMPISMGNESLTSTIKALSSTQINSHKPIAPISLANSQIDSALSRFEGPSSENVAIFSRHLDTKGYNQMLGDPETRCDEVAPAPPKIDTSGTKGVSRLLTISDANRQVNTLTQLPLTETVQPIDSVTQSLLDTIKPTNPTHSHLFETILPMNSLTQLPLTDTTQAMGSLTQAMGSLTQFPLTETIQPKALLPQLSLEISQSITSPCMETIQSVNTLVQIPLTETIQPVHSLTETSVTEVTGPIDSLTQIPLTETIVNNASLAQLASNQPCEKNVQSESMVQKGNALNVISMDSDQMSSSVVHAASGFVDNSKRPQNVVFDILNDQDDDDFDSRTDIFKTSNFMQKGFQSTRISSEELREPVNAQAEHVVLSHSDDLDVKALQRHSTPDTDRNSDVESIQNQPQHSLIRQENISSESSNIGSESLDLKGKDSVCNSLQEEVQSSEVTKTNVEPNLSDGEIAHGNGKSTGEVSQIIDVFTEEGKSDGEVILEENPMEQYMHMILAKRKAENVVKNDELEADIQHSIHEDVPLSETDKKNEDSEPSSSEFEW